MVISRFRVLRYANPTSSKPASCLQCQNAPAVHSSAMSSEEKYNLLPDEDRDEDALRAAFSDRPPRRPLHLRTWVVLAQTLVMTVALVGWALSVRASRHIAHGSQVVYCRCIVSNHANIY